MKDKFVLRVAAESNYLKLIRQFFARIIENDFSKDEIYYMEICLNEVCENIVNHGYNGDSGRIEMRVRNEKTYIMIEILDRAKPFNLLKYKPVEKEKLVEQGIKGKLGIRKVKTICDKVRYQRLKGKNKIVLIKYKKNLKAAALKKR